MKIISILYRHVRLFLTLFVKCNFRSFRFMKFIEISHSVLFFSIFCNIFSRALYVNLITVTCNLNVVSMLPT